MRYLSVCSGIEAATVAWHPLGWEPTAFAEIEKFPSAVLAHHYPHVPNLGDMNGYEGWNLDGIDLLVGGTPCQSFSVAGLRLGMADARGNLALVYCRLAARLRPRWVVWENVPGVLSSNGGRDFGSILGALVDLGYGVCYRVLDAQHFGVPQRRRRVFVVGYLGDWRRAAAVLLERHSLSGNPPPRREARESFTHEIAPSLEASDRGFERTKDPRGQDCVIPVAFGGNNTTGPIDVATAINAHGGPHGRLDFESETFVTHSLRADGFDASEDGTGRGMSFIVEQNSMSSTPTFPSLRSAEMPNYAVCFSSKDYGADASEIAPTLRAAGHTTSHANHGAAPAVAFQTSQSGVREVNAHATLDGNNGSRRHNGIVQEMKVRRLTPRECERLQGFPDDYTLIDMRGKPAADGPRYKALGNSMAVPCMRWIGRRIAAVDAL